MNSVSLATFEKLDESIDSGLKQNILSFILQNYSIVDGSSMLNKLEKEFYQETSDQFGVDVFSVKDVVESSLNKVINLNLFLRKNPVRARHEFSGRVRIVRIYLHMYHRIVPVFDYDRAKHNLVILHKAFDIIDFHPCLSTQLALVIYITDIKAEPPIKGQYLLQKNIRAICDSSAYAFHRTRNILQKRLNLKF